MEYNTTRNKLVIPEYGRNIQKLIDYAMTIEDKAKRTNMAYLIVYIMAQMNPQSRDSGDYKRKLWDHMFIISNFKLDVDSPYPAPSPESLYEKPQKLDYNENEIAFKHYGKNLEKIIAKAMDYEDGAEKDALIRTIANHMKKSYLNWNRDSVNDQLIFDHLEILSNGKLKLKENQELSTTSEILAKTRRKKFTRPTRENGSNGGRYSSNGSGGSRYSSNGGNGRRRRPSN